MNQRHLRPVAGVGDSLERLKEFPREAQCHIGRALDYAQRGGMHPKVKPLKGLGRRSFSTTTAIS